MRRRDLLGGLAASFGFGGSAFPQHSPIKAHFAIVGSSEKLEDLTAQTPLIKLFFDEMSKGGFVEGQNLVVQRYSALGQLERYDELASTVIKSNPDLIFPLNGRLALHFKEKTSTIPLLVSVPDPVSIGLIESLARPGGNVTGAGVDPGLEVWAKRLQLLKEILPSLSTVALLIPSLNTRSPQAIIEVLHQAAERTGMNLRVASLDNRVDRQAYEREFEAMSVSLVDGLIVSDSPEHRWQRKPILDLAARHRLPTIYPFREYIQPGGLLSYGVDVTDVTRRLAGIGAQILRGTKPGDIPYYQQIRLELALNSRTARSLGLEFPAAMLALADEVIE